MNFKNMNMVSLWLAFAAAFWIIDALVDAVVFNEGSIFNQLFQPGTDDLILRLIIALIFILIGGYTQGIKPEIKDYSTGSTEGMQILQNIIDNLPHLIFWKNTDLIFLGCNKKFANELGLRSPAEIIGKSDFELLSNPKDAEIFRENDRKVLDTGIPEIRTSTREISADGDEIWLEINRMPLYDAKGKIIGVLGTSEDITYRKKAEKENLKLSQTLSDRVKELTSLYAIDREIESGHDLSVILDEISKITLNALRYPEKAWLRITVKDRIHNLNKEFIDESSFISGELKVHGEPVGSVDVGYKDGIKNSIEEIDLVTAVSGRVGRLIERLDLQDKMIEKERYESTQKLAAAVAHEISQPLQSLTIISDLAKSNWGENTHLLDGIPEQLKRISLLVEKMLNLTTVETMDYAGGVEIVDILKSGGGSAPKSRKVLVIDDNDAVLNLLVEVIQKQGYEVESASTGENGLSLIKENNYGLILCDIKLPDISGFEIFEQVNEDLEESAFTFMSGYIVGEDNIELIKKSDGFMKKPFTVEEVQNLLNRVFENKE